MGESDCPVVPPLMAENILANLPANSFTSFIQLGEPLSTYRLLKTDGLTMFVPSFSIAQLVVRKFELGQLRKGIREQHVAAPVVP
jgi:hypothetical protein